MRRPQILVSIFVLAMLSAVLWRWIDRPLPRGQIPPLAIDYRIDVNHADESQLRLLPQIGETLAARIVQDRQANGPFEKAEDLKRIRGIGPKTVELILPFVTCGQPTAGPPPPPASPSPIQE